ncbi:dTDP-4-oxo-6-deoxy-D-allose reductase [Nonomuraea coxensis DSM 45129]|uniref:dTDP-4-oxo-6-deoxy-D-allose reductase n=1 Tax=Nonomuraea coxensis DSM 45129 TaxID=1122611 RepID=A0ABX8TWA7_9ACTN|nr:NAD(P)-dependent oxidoreductase [Nonomuraea coxensis]QYC39551.1 dTDP-4-oxo-6-deoxy-D-allose reductase [Nonomuraea coxensis DSM 45129]
MKVLVAGATGVIGRQLVPLLKAVGHEVVTLSRRGDLAVDALDREATVRAVRRVRPDAVVHLLTAIPPVIDPRRIGRQFALTNRLRDEGTRTLVEAAPGARIIAQGLAYAYAPAPGLADEDAPLWREAPTAYRPVVAALESLERQTVAAGGLVLRFGHLTGPGSAYAEDGSTTRSVLAGRMPVVGDGGSVLSFTHAHDAATAVVAALDRDVTGALNIVDDTPVTMREWLPAFAARLGAPPPRRVPAFLARMAVGAFGVAYMTRLRGADNCRARLLLNWRPRHTAFLEETA